MYFVGADVGSVAIKIIIMDEKGNIIEKYYRRHYGHPIKKTIELLKNVKERVGKYSLSITGNASKPIANQLGIKSINEIVSQSYSVKKLFPWINTIIEMGGEDSKLILLENGKIKDFSMNSVCAAGTGSFLEQQAERLRLSIEEFSEIAQKSKRPSKIAGRCSVFAKSDMIHLQQIATPVEDIIAGLCFAVARNFKGAIAKGRDLITPVSFQGGVAANKGMIRAFREVFELDELFIPPYFAFMGAIGAALKDKDEGCINSVDLEKMDHLLLNSKSTKGHAPLVSIGDDFYERHIKGSQESRVESQEFERHESRIKAYLGIDIGSISTNLAVIDEKGNLLAKRYLMTAGRPIETVKQGLDEIYKEIGERIEIIGVGTTGSGRYMIADYVGADIVKNEITAQATAAMFIDPEVDTIFEIGGQDSKYISLKNGTIVDFEMNKACAAGTGSFLEEQAEKLDISIKDEFSELAFRSKNPCRLGERCTVFMENSLMANLQKGTNKDDLLAGLAYSIVQNYINRVVAGKPVGDRIFFQGGVAFNKAVVAAFEKYTGKKIIVPPHHDVTGAIGMALIARDYMKRQKTEEIKTKFKGFELSKKPYEISSFECKGCPNVCEINKVKIEGEAGYLFYGGRCEKYDVRRSQKSTLPDLFSFREEQLWKGLEKYKDFNSFDELKNDPITKTVKSRAKIGIPYIFFFHDYLPFWSTLLSELGFEVVVSPKTSKQIINLGVENVLSESCFPVKVAHGHIKWLQDSGLELILIPSFINLNQDDKEYQRGVACPYTQTIPYLSKAAIRNIKPITPIIDMSRGKNFLVFELVRVFKEYRITENQIINALNKAESSQREFQKAIKQKGEEILSKINREKTLSIVIVGRAYNSFDSGINLQIPQKLAQLGVISIPMDMLPLEEESIRDSWPNMYWRSGQKILRAARIIRDNPNLYAIYIGNFSCGPDSFILKYFNKEMSGKSFLHLEIDEHSADAGAITRCEAFLDSIRSQESRVKSHYSSLSLVRPSIHPSSKKRTVYIPNMTDHAFSLAAAFEKCGIPAEVLPLSDKQSVELGKKHLSGKECYPCTVTTGDMLKKIQSPDFIPHKSAFFMPTACGPCRFGQYNVIQRLILNELGYSDVVILSPEQHSNTFQDIGIEGKDFTKIAWKGIVAFDLLYKCLHETRPYEKEKGISDELYENYKKKIYESLKGLDGSIDIVMDRIKRDFYAIRKIKEKKPLIGIVGEIFVRSHIFSNENLIKKIENIGGEVWLSPMGEWIYYVNYLELRRRLIKKDLSAIIKFLLKRFFQQKVEHQLSKPFTVFLKTVEEPSTKEVLKKASPYVHDSFEGETILSIGKAIDLIEKGASGIINAMPFGCMPGTIVTALLRAVSIDYNIPCISIPYDGTESSVIEVQLEAFMEATRNQGSVVSKITNR
jgi:predicted CoA-substrate-specific enzyme activase